MTAKSRALARRPQLSMHSFQCPPLRGGTSQRSLQSPPLCGGTHTVTSPTSPQASSSPQRSKPARSIRPDDADHPLQKSPRPAPGKHRPDDPPAETTTSAPAPPPPKNPHAPANTLPKIPPSTRATPRRCDTTHPAGTASPC